MKGPNPGAPYTVGHGMYCQRTEEFATFEAALASYKEHAKEGDAQLTGARQDIDWDGLTDEEREQL